MTLGLFVIQPAEVESFLTPLPVGRIPGVGKVTEAKLAKLGLCTGGELRSRPLEQLQSLFGRYDSACTNCRAESVRILLCLTGPTKSISAEDTFEQHVVLAETDPLIRRLADKAWLASRKESRTAKTVILKLKTAEFRVLTRSQTPPSGGILEPKRD